MIDRGRSRRIAITSFLCGRALTLAIKRILLYYYPNKCMCLIAQFYVIIIFLCFRFLNYLENEIFNANSPIWHTDYNQTPEALTVASPAGSSKTPTPSPAAGPASNISKIGTNI